MELQEILNVFKLSESFKVYLFADSLNVDFFINPCDCLIKQLSSFSFVCNAKNTKRLCYIYDFVSCKALDLSFKSRGYFQSDISQVLVLFIC